MKPIRRRTSRSDVSALLRADVTGTTPDPGLVQRLAVTAMQAPAPATAGRSFALRSGLGAVLAAGVTVVAGVGASYAVGVVDPPWAPPAEAPQTPSPSERGTTPAPPASSDASPDSTSVSSERPTSVPPTERSHGRRGDEKGGPHRPTDIPGKGKGPGHDRGRGNDGAIEPRDRSTRSPRGAATPDRGNDTDPGQGRGQASDGKPSPAATRSAHGAGATTGLDR